MKRAAIDSDGLIKLAKSGLLEKICKNIRCEITESVYKEAVSEGIKRFYEDAFRISELVNKGCIKKNKVDAKLTELSLGEGEVSTFYLLKQSKANFIVSDDKKFLRHLEEHEAPFITPAELIAAMVKSNKLTKAEAMEGLVKIQNIITNEAFESAKRKMR